MKTETKSDWDIVIVGAGPVGLALAKGLALDQRRVLLLEKKPRLSEHSKAATLWPKTQEVVSRLGIISEFEKASFIHKVMHIWDTDAKPEKALVDFPLKELKDDTKFPRLLVLPQDFTEKILADSLIAEKSVDLVFSAEVCALNDEGSGVSITYKKNGLEVATRARFVVGCDGPHSFVRESLGFKLEGETYPVKAALADIRLGKNGEFPSPRLSTEDGLCVGFQLTRERWRLIFIEPADATRNIEDLVKNAVQNLFGQSEYKLDWKSEFRLHRRTSQFFAKGNLVLAGDAAHLNSPLGGQGMNAGIQDTEVLRAALNKALIENSNAAILRYGIERKRAVESGVNRFTGLMTSAFFFQHGRHIRVVIAALRTLLRIPAVRHKFLRRAAMLD